MSSSLDPSSCTISIPAACASAKVASEATTALIWLLPDQRAPMASITDQTARPDPRPIVMSDSMSCTAASAAAALPGENSYAPDTAIGGSIAGGAAA
jgi:hypothetical protein